MSFKLHLVSTQPPNLRRLDSQRCLAADGRAPSLLTILADRAAPLALLARERNFITKYCKTMKLNTLKDLYFHELKDLYSAEKRIIKALPKMVKAATNDKLASGRNILSRPRAMLNG